MKRRKKSSVKVRHNEALSRTTVRLVIPGLRRNGQSVLFSQRFSASTLSGTGKFTIKVIPDSVLTDKTAGFM